jgi:RNA polymerase primary sigma factor
VKANLRFVVSVARNYQNQKLPLEDLINEGNIGLIRAAYRFDERKNFKFISYAVWWIRQAILQALADQSRIVKLPLNRVGKIYKVGKTREALEQRYLRPPDEREVSEELGCDEAEVSDTMKIGNDHTSLDSPVGRDGTSKALDLIEDRGQAMPDETVLQTSLRDEIDDVLRTRLTKNEREIILKYFGIGSEAANTLDEIGRRANLTRERVRQIKNSALQKLRKSNKMHLLREYMGQD